MEGFTVKIVAHLKTGKCPKNSYEKSRGRRRRKYCILRASMGRKKY